MARPPRSADTTTAITGIPWTWGVTHRAGGALLIAFIFSLFVAKQYRKPVFALLCVGIASHFVIDCFPWYPTANTNCMRWPSLDCTVDD